MPLHSTLSWLPISKKLHVGCLNGCYDQDDDTVKHANTDNLHHADENNATAHHVGGNEFMQKKQTDNFNKIIIICIMAIMNKMMEKI